MSVVSRLGLLALLVSSGLGCASQRSDARVPRAVAAPQQAGAPALMQPANLIAPTTRPAPTDSARAANDEVTPGPCPLERVVGASVGVEHLDDGAALVLTTHDDVVALRSRVKKARLRPSGTSVARTRARFDNVERGIRIVFAAPSASDATSVQSELDRYALVLAKRCAMALVEPGSEDEPTTVDESAGESAPDTSDSEDATPPSDEVEPEDEPKKDEPDASEDSKEEAGSEAPPDDANEGADDDTNEPGAGDDDSGDDEEPPDDGDEPPYGGGDDDELAHHTSCGH